MDTPYVIWAILLSAALTFIIRAVPFILSRALIETPIIQKAAKIMPLLIMTILVLHSFNGVAFSINGAAIPLLVGILLTIVTHLKFRLPILSIGIGVTSHSLLLILLGG